MPQSRNDTPRRAAGLDVRYRDPCTTIGAIVTRQLPTVCIIGAGSSGLTTVKALKDNGIPFDCFEKSSQVGGLWVYNNPNGLSGAYRGLNSNAPKGLMQYAEYPLPKHLPGFPSHWDFAEYFHNYARHFGLLEHITFNTSVEHVRPLPDDSMEVALSDGSRRRYDCVIVANGHHWSPRWPNPAFPGDFDGTQMHSHNYRAPEIAAGKRVVVVGMGNSAMDICSEVSILAERTYLSARSGVHILPKYVFGRPAPSWIYRLFSFRLGQHALAVATRLTEGRPQDFGLPTPTHLPGQTHPSGSDQIYTALRRGRITPKPNIAELRGDSVAFVDGSTADADLIIYCTGYNIEFPFFDPAYISAPDNEIKLFKQVFHPDHPRIFFVGLFQPLGSVQPIAELQSKWIAKYLTGRYTLPERTAIRQSIDDDSRWRAKRFVKSARNTIEIDHFVYARKVRKEIRAGRRRSNGVLSSTPVSSDDGATETMKLKRA
jgi:dimethylaniline monooxygenase (N-oxide forming)